jgi:hypothetical protein
MVLVDCEWRTSSSYSLTKSINVPYNVRVHNQFLYSLAATFFAVHDLYIFPKYNFTINNWRIVFGNTRDNGTVVYIMSKLNHANNKKTPEVVQWIMYGVHTRESHALLESLHTSSISRHQRAQCTVVSVWYSLQLRNHFCIYYIMDN